MRDPKDKTRPLSKFERRSLEEARVAMVNAAKQQIAFQHTVLCQTCMPYRNPGDEVRVWERRQGNVALSVEAGRAHHPETGRWVEPGLPFGPKARLILAHLNAEALRTGSPEIEVERSLTGFVRRLQDPTKRGKAGPNGPTIRTFKTSWRDFQAPSFAWPRQLMTSRYKSTLSSWMRSSFGSRKPRTTGSFGTKPSI